MSDPIKIKPKTQTKCTLHTPGDSEIIDIMPVTQSLGHFWDFNYTLGQHVLYETLRKLYCVCPESQAAGLYSRNKTNISRTVQRTFRKTANLHSWVWSLNVVPDLLAAVSSVRVWIVLYSNECKISFGSFSNTVECKHVDTLKTKLIICTKTVGVSGFIGFKSNMVEIQMLKY